MKRILLLISACLFSACTTAIHNEPLEIRIQGTYGCFAPLPYQYWISMASGKYVFTVNGKRRPLSSGQARAILAQLRRMQLKDKYGTLHTTADFTGYMEMRFMQNGSRIHKKIALTIGKVLDPGFKKLVETMMATLQKKIGCH